LRNEITQRLHFAALEKQMKALLAFRITVDHDDKDTPVYCHVKLYREQKELVWRADSEFGDEIETLPRPTTVRQAKKDACAVYPRHSPFKPSARWI
jgi:hypothetical protein